jgi:hypothetical protein
MILNQPHHLFFCSALGSSDRADPANDRYCFDDLPDQAQPSIKPSREP